MTHNNYKAVEIITKWGTILFAWCSWALAVYEKSIWLFLLGFVPYLLIYNWIVKGIIYSRLFKLEDSKTSDKNQA